MLQIEEAKVLYLKMEDKMKSFKDKQNDLPELSHFDQNVLQMVKTSEVVIYQDDSKKARVLKSRY